MSTSATSSVPGRADADEIEEMIEAGRVNPNATRSSLLAIADLWISEQVRRRVRRRALKIERSAQRVNIDEARLARITRITSDIATKASTEWSDLLDVAFSLPTGRRVTWREATVDDHRSRAEMLEGMAAADIEAAAIHREAIAAIRAAHASSLGGAL